MNMKQDMQRLFMPPRVTVLGVGNVILRDEGFGVRVAEHLQAHYQFPEEVQILDGGTLGMELLEFLTGTQCLLILDSIDGNQPAGTLFRFENDDVLEHFQEKLSAHEVGIQDVLASLKTTGKSIPQVVVLGAQPYEIGAGVGLSPEMTALLPRIEQQALQELTRWNITYQEKAEQAMMNDHVVYEAFQERSR